MPNFILLTGAGFSRNWGGWLADEAFEYLLGHPKIDDGLRQLLWRHKGKGGFEAAVDEQRTETIRANPYPMMGVSSNVPMLGHSQQLDEAIQGMFADMNKAFFEMHAMKFDEFPNYPMMHFLAGFDAIFTLNLDLLMEYHYRAGDPSLPPWHKRWHMPGMERTAEAPDTAIRYVEQWRPMNSSKFALDKNRQPYFKLHGSSNWIDTVNGQPMLVIGGKKATEIGRHKILTWNYQQFEACLSKPDTRLMVIGYSFGDEHINTALIDAARGGSLRLFIIDPCGVDVLERSPLAASTGTLPDPKQLQGYVVGASRRLLSQIFGGGDPVEHAKVMRFFA